MNELSPEQYEAVLKYMETTNEENFELATTQLQQHSFNLQSAVNSRFQPAHQPPAHRQAQPVDDEAIVRRYIQHVQLKNSQWSIVDALWKAVKSLLLILLHLVLKIVPEHLAMRYLGSEFQKIYLGRVAYRHRTLDSLLAKTKNLSSKSVLLVISPKQAHPQVLAFLNSAPYKKKIDQNFFMTCSVVGSQELKTVEGAQESPQIIVLRMDIFQQMVVVARLRDLHNASVEMLDRWAHDGRNLFRRDGNVLIKYRNYVARFYGQHYEQEQEDEVNLVERQQNTHQIRQQNEAYKAVEQQVRESKKAEEQRMLRQRQESEQVEELFEERRLRKMSIPDEPTSGEIIRISFRCPDGKTIIRNFAADEKLQLIYNWVEVNEQIEFQDHRRQFEIMYSYPPVPLSDRKDKLLSEVFESSQERVAIKEL